MKRTDERLVNFAAIFATFIFIYFLKILSFKFFFFIYFNEKFSFHFLFLIEVWKIGKTQKIIIFCQYSLLRSDSI